VDFSGVKAAAWIGFPFQMQDTVFGLLGSGSVNKGLLISSIIMIVPIAFATMMEHVGDISAIGGTIGKNLIEDPGLHRTLIGDGIGTTIAALFGAPANTTYGENTGVLVLTKVYDPKVVRLAALFAIVLSFCPKFAALISAMPAATVGGVSIILYGMISAVGVRNMVENHTDFQKSRNVIVAAVILGLALGVNFSGFLGANITTAGNNAVGAISFTIGNMRIGLSGLAIASIVGILLNAILPGKRDEYMPNQENSGSLGKF
jgi:uracil permease